MVVENVVVPAPLQVTELAGEPFVVGPAACVRVAEPGLVPLGALLADRLGRVRGHAVAVVVGGAAGEVGEVRLALTGGAVDDEAPGDAATPGEGSDDEARGALPPGEEAYRLRATAEGVAVTARTTAGLHHGLATLSQLVRTDEDGRVSVPPVDVLDAPRYGWRGLCLDVARHFVAPADLRLVVDLLAGYKLTVLHLHLTDDQAWRLDLPSRPELVARSSSSSVDGDPGGHYTQGDWADLLAYAAARGVRVLPEIDVPGHVNAALHAYGELVPGGEPAPEYLGIEVGFSRLTAGLPATAPFLADVFADVAAMTPGEHLHLGGDEAHTLDRAEYVALVEAAAREVVRQGRVVVGWQEVAAASLPAGSVVQYWDERLDPAPILAAARAGARVLLSPASRTYLDMRYDEAFPLGQDWAGTMTVRQAYDWEPSEAIPGLDPDAVIGVEAGLWTETLRTRDDLTTMLLPRLAAVAEVAWSAPERRDWDDFARRLAAQRGVWDEAGLVWHRAAGVDWTRADTRGER